jgi:outer membrane protein
MIKRWLIPFCFCAYAVHAQVTVEDCVRMALETNPALKTAEAERDASRAEAKQARTTLLPSLDFSGSYRRQSVVPEINIAPVTLPFGGTFSPFPGGMRLGSLETTDFRLTVSQPIFTGFRLTERKRAAEAQSQSKSHEADAKRNEIVYRVEAAYAGALNALEWLEIARTARDQIEVHRRDADSFLRQGLARPDEVLKADVKLSEADLAVVQAEHAVRLSRIVLANEIGRPLSEETGLAPMDSTQSETVSIENSVALGIANRPELKALQAAQKAGISAKKAAKGTYWPSLAAFGTAGYGKPGLDFIKQDWMDYWLAGVSVEWNLWNWGRTSASVRQAESKWEAVTQQAFQVRNAVILDIQQACLKRNEAEQKLALNRKMADQTETLFRVTENRFKQGQASNTEYFDAQSDFTRVRLGLAQAKTDLALAKANWRRAVGFSFQGVVKTDKSNVKLSQ